MQKLQLVIEKKVRRDAEYVAESEVSSSGNGACIYVPKKYLKRKAIIGILK